MATFNQLINDNRPVLVDFYADWCQPCKMVAPILKEVKDSLGDKVRIIKIDVDKNPILSSRYNIRGVPTLMLFKNGQLLFNQAGVIPAGQIKNLVLANQ
ncbi:MAG: thioredoxin [Bacteroidales bacterium]|nr:thioredoxin [Bacteroidales bacterium]